MKIKISLPKENYTKEYEVKEFLLEKNLLSVTDKDMSALGFMNKGHVQATIGNNYESKLVLNFINSTKISDKARAVWFQIL